MPVKDIIWYRRPKINSTENKLGVKSSDGISFDATFANKYGSWF